MILSNTPPHWNIHIMIKSENRKTMMK